MKPLGTYHCEVCGASSQGDNWFLVTEDPERDTLQILRWNRYLAEQPSVRHLCSAAHVEQLVSHWMLSGSLDLSSRPFRTPLGQSAGGDTDASYRLGELMLDRSSFAALGERPDMLNSILEAIDGALNDAACLCSAVEEEEEEDEELTETVYEA